MGHPVDTGRRNFASLGKLICRSTRFVAPADLDKLVPFSFHLHNKWMKFHRVNIVVPGDDGERGGGRGRLSGGRHSTHFGEAQASSVAGVVRGPVVKAAHG